MYDVRYNSGLAPRQSYVEIPMASVPGIVAAEEPTLFDGSIPSELLRRYAQMVHITGGSLAVSIPGTVDVSGSDVTVSNVVAVQSEVYTSLIESNSAAGITWVAEAAPGTALAAAAWRVKRITTTVVGPVESTRIEWADSGAFTSVATPPLSGLTYT